MAGDGSREAGVGRSILFTGALLVLLMPFSLMRGSSSSMRCSLVCFILGPHRHCATLLTARPVGPCCLSEAVGALFAPSCFCESAFSQLICSSNRLTLIAIHQEGCCALEQSPGDDGWGLIVVSLFAFCIATGLLGLIVVFPLLGHASWHAYLAVR